MAEHEELEDLTPEERARFILRGHPTIESPFRSVKIAPETLLVQMAEQIRQAEVVAARKALASVPTSSLPLPPTIPPESPPSINPVEEVSNAGSRSADEVGGVAGSLRLPAGEGGDGGGVDVPADPPPVEAGIPPVVASEGKSAGDKPGNVAAAVGGKGHRGRRE